MINLGLSLNFGGNKTLIQPIESLFLTFTDTTIVLSGDDISVFDNVSPTFTIISTPSPINIKYVAINALLEPYSPQSSKIQYSKNGGSFVDATMNTNFTDTFVNNDTLLIRVQGTAFGIENYSFVLQNGSSVISNTVQVSIALES